MRPKAPTIKGFASKTPASDSAYSTDPPWEERTYPTLSRPWRVGKSCISELLP
ncbi:MAG: hypothetical protein QXR44_02265 [Thermoproteota archaeon]